MSHVAIGPPKGRQRKRRPEQGEGHSSSRRANYISSSARVRPPSRRSTAMTTQFHVTPSRLMGNDSNDIICELVVRLAILSCAFFHPAALVGCTRAAQPRTTTLIGSSDWTAPSWTPVAGTRVCLCVGGDIQLLCQFCLLRRARKLSSV